MHRPRSSMCLWQLNNLHIYFSLVCLNLCMSVCMSRFGYVFQALKFQPMIKIMPQNFQDMILEVYTVHQECHIWPCHPLLLSGSLNVLQVPPFMTPPSWHTSNLDINMKIFGMLLNIREHHSWHQEWPGHQFLWSGTLNVSQVPTFLTPPSWQTSNWDINTKFSGYLPWGKRT